MEERTNSSPRDVFGIIVRAFGLLLTVLWVLTLIEAILMGSGRVLLRAFVFCIFGGYFLKGAPLVMEWAYPLRGAKVKNDTGGSVTRRRIRESPKVQTGPFPLELKVEERPRLEGDEWKGEGAGGR